MLKVAVREDIEREFQERFGAVRVHCPFPVLNFLFLWVDCGALAHLEVDHEFYCDKHADYLMNID
jgi:hypothetical protein